MTLIEGALKAHFLITNAPRCRERPNSNPYIAPLYPWSLPYNAESYQGSIKYQFWVFGMTRPEIEPQSSGPLANTLLHYYIQYVSAGMSFCLLPDEEGRRTYRPKLCEYKNKYEVSSLNIRSNNNYQASSHLRNLDKWFNTLRIKHTYPRQLKYTQCLPSSQEL